MASMINFMTVEYFVHFQIVSYSSLQDHIIGKLVVNPRHSYIFPPCFTLVEDVLTNVQ